MRVILTTIIIFIPVLNAVILEVVFVLHMKKDEKDEKEYMKTLSDEEKKEYLLQKSKDMQAEQSYYRMNDIVSNKK